MSTVSTHSMVMVVKMILVLLALTAQACLGNGPALVTALYALAPA